MGKKQYILGYLGSVHQAERNQAIHTPKCWWPWEVIAKSKGEKTT